VDAGSVWVSRLACSHFRSYAQLDVTLPEGPVAFVGSNGAGKTNLLEAISLFAPGRGLRGAPAAEVASRNAEGELLNASGTWAVSAHVETPLGGRQLGVGLDTAGGKRVLRLDGKNKNGATAFAEIMPILWLTPDDDALWRGPALDRRRFFDQLVAAYDPGHVSNAQAYGQVMRQRLKILKDATKANTAPDTTWLDSLEESMARQGVAMAAARRGLMRRLSACRIGLSAASGLFPARGWASKRASKQPLRWILHWMSKINSDASWQRFAPAMALWDNRPSDRTALTWTCTMRSMDEKPRNAPRGSKRHCCSRSFWAMRNC